MTQINGLTGLVLSLGTGTFTVAINTTAFGAYVSGGTVYVASQAQAIVQGLITSASLRFLNDTGRTLGANGTGPYAGIDSYTDTYDGNDGIRMFLVNAPIVTVSSLVVGNTAINQSLNFNSGGFVIDGTKASLSIRNGGGTTVTLGAPGFYGTFGPYPQSVFVSYTAGYAITPQDISDTITYFVAEVYRGKDWLGQASQNLAELGTISYRAWDQSPRVKHCVSNYKRYALV